MHNSFNKWREKPPRGTTLIQDHPLNKGLVGFWPLWEQAGEFANDISGSRARGTLTNIPVPGTGVAGWRVARKNAGIAFDNTASNQYIFVGNNPIYKLLGEMSVFCSFLFTATTAQYMIGHFRNSINTQCFSLRNDGSSIIGFGWASVPAVAAATTTVTTKIWYKAVGVRTGTTGSWEAKLYADWSIKPDYLEANATTATNPAVNNETNDAVAIGARATTVSQGSFFGGIIDDARIWNRALTKEEVRILFQEPYSVFEAPLYRKYFFNPASTAAAPIYAIRNANQLLGGGYVS